MIKSLGASRSFGQKLVLNEISFSAQRGDLIEVQGRNGSGKTTWLKVLAGLLLPTKGQVFVDGIETSKDPLFIKEILSFSSASDNGFFPRLTGLQNLKFFCASQNVFHKQILENLKTLNHYFSHQECLNTPYYQMSSGMKQLLKLTYVFCLNKKIWLLDEPLRSLDYSTRQGVVSFIKYHRNEKVIVYTNHSDFEWRALNPKIFEMNNKNLKPVDQAGSHEKLFELS